MEAEESLEMIALRRRRMLLVRSTSFSVLDMSSYGVSISQTKRGDSIVLFVVFM